jgi:hypothetical protein
VGHAMSVSLVATVLTFAMLVLFHLAGADVISSKPSTAVSPVVSDTAGRDCASDVTREIVTTPRLNGVTSGPRFALAIGWIEFSIAIAPAVNDRVAPTDGPSNLSNRMRDTPQLMMREGPGPWHCRSSSSAVASRD